MTMNNADVIALLFMIAFAGCMLDLKLNKLLAELKKLNSKDK
jgi:hypothetical protein